MPKGVCLHDFFVKTHQVQTVEGVTSLLDKRHLLTYTCDQCWCLRKPSAVILFSNKYSRHTVNRNISLIYLVCRRNMAFSVKKVITSKGAVKHDNWCYCHEKRLLACFHRQLGMQNDLNENVDRASEFSVWFSAGFLRHSAIFGCFSTSSRLCFSEGYWSAQAPLTFRRCCSIS